MREKLERDSEPQSQCLSPAVNHFGFLLPVPPPPPPPPPAIPDLPVLMEVSTDELALLSFSSAP